MKFSYKRIFLLFGIAIIYANGIAQETWNWEKCIDYALKNNLQLQQADVNIALGEATLKGNKMGYSPMINADVNYNLRIGNNFNFFNSSYERQLVHYQDYGVNLSQPIIDLVTPATVKKSKLELSALKLDQETLKNNIQLQLLTAFLNIMNANEQKEQATQQHQTTKEQFDRMNTLIASGAAAENAILDIEAQLTNEALSISQIKNQLDIAYLNLKMLLQLDPKQSIHVEIPRIPELLTLDAIADVNTIYEAALGLRPEIKSAQLKARSAQQQINVAKGNYYPSLNFISNVNTFFTTQNKSSQTTTTGNFVPSGAIVDGTFQSVLIPETITTQSKNPYKKQLNQNLSYAFGLTLNVPIFNKFQVQTAVKQSRLNYKMALLSEKQAGLDLFNSIQQAHIKAQAAIENYTAADKNYSIAQKSYDYALERLHAGSISQLEVNTAKNNVAIALSKLTQSKYEYLFNTKLLDFYQGKKIEL
ncbi:MAG TPA: TolC family protein [Chitinophagales bacterium]|nr:TolC family protein [Chitinophagales bacterium]HMZ32925.1 TolC family protein [Chitinophagales bacterium]